MSSFKTPLRTLLVSIGFLAPAALLAGCVLTPVYSDGARARHGVALAYAEPNSRLEQIVYQELGRSFGPDSGKGAPLVQVSISPGARAVVHTVNPGIKTNYEMAVTGTITIVQPGPEPKTILQATRHASASYTTDGQVLADNAAEVEAAERATRALAESFRLTMLATFAASPTAQ
jgi:hypothetical protein